jgi:hypothetical protein
MQTLVAAESKRCYSCIQWDGTRSTDVVKGKIKVDPGAEGLCRVKHVKTKGSFTCEHYFRLK